MKVEIRADSVHISGYVNVPGRESRPVLTSRGKVVEVIEQRAFQRAIEKAQNIELRVDHERAIASTADKTLEVYEDAVGLRAESVITDPEIMQAAREKKLRGWSFNMMNIKDEVEERAGQLPLRRVKEFDMSEITLALRKNPVYSSTSIEVRTEGDTEIELRSTDDELIIEDISKEQPNEGAFFMYKNRINNLKASRKG